MYCMVGADGFFGAYWQEQLSLCSEPYFALNHRVALQKDEEYCVKNIPFELTDEASVIHAVRLMAEYAEPLRVIYLAAAHNPDFVKNHPQIALQINTEYYERFLYLLTKECRVESLIYASSDTVYGESINGYRFSETDEPNPINEYGRQKALAEDITLQYGFAAARFPYLYGKSLTQKKHFCDEIENSIRQGKPVKLYTDYVRSCISYETAAFLTYKLSGLPRFTGVINVCADKPMSKYELGLLIAENARVDFSLIVPESMDNSSVFSEKRAKSILMNNGLLKNILGMRENSVI